jgi:hypothetical protein
VSIITSLSQAIDLLPRFQTLLSKGSVGGSPGLGLLLALFGFMFLLLNGVGMSDRLRGGLLSRHVGLRVCIRRQKRRQIRMSLTWWWNNNGGAVVAVATQQ